MPRQPWFPQSIDLVEEVPTGVRRRIHDGVLNPGVIRMATRDRTHQEYHRPKGFVPFVQPVGERALEGRPV